MNVLRGLFKDFKKCFLCGRGASLPWERMGARMFILAADDFNQAYRRLKYMQQISEARDNQAENINQSDSAG